MNKADISPDQDGERVTFIHPLDQSRDVVSKKVNPSLFVAGQLGANHGALVDAGVLQEHGLHLMAGHQGKVVLEPEMATTICTEE